MNVHLMNKIWGSDAALPVLAAFYPFIYICFSGASFIGTLDRLSRYLKSRWWAFSQSWQTGAFWETSWKRCRSTLPPLARYETNTHNACLPAWLPSDFLCSGWERVTWHKHDQNSTFTHISKSSCLFCVHWPMGL